MSYVEGIPLLQYVDDATFFMYGLVEEVRSLSTLLDLFIFFSGLQIIYPKSLLWALDYTRNRRYNAQRPSEYQLGVIECRAYIGN